MSTVVAGRELDALVAERVMGWTYKTFPDGVLPHVKHWHGPNDECLLPCYSISIAAAWQVVERLIEDGEAFCCGLNYDTITEQWVFLMRQHGEVLNANYWPHADTAPLAICLAALRAIESK
jgi:hypothetical protein